MLFPMRGKKNLIFAVFESDLEEVLIQLCREKYLMLPLTQA